MCDGSREEMALRIGALERENRRLKVIGAVSLAAVAVLLLIIEGQVRSIPPPPPAPYFSQGTLAVQKLMASEVIASQVFIQGKQSGSGVVLGQSNEGMPIVYLMDRDKSRLSLALRADGSPSLALFDARGSNRMEAATSQSGDPWVLFSDAQAGRTLWLSTNALGASIILLDKATSGGASLSVGSQGASSSLVLSDESTKSNLGLTVTSGQPSLDFEGNGGRRASLGLLDKNMAAMRLFGSDGSSAVLVASPNLAPFFSLTNKDGTGQMISGASTTSLRLPGR
jgi:hypothetical protein